MRAGLRVPLPVEGVRLSLWRAVAIFRVGSLAICLFLIVQWQDIYERPAVALAAGTGMIVVTAGIGVLAVTGRAHRPSVVVGDLVVTAGLTLLSIPAQTLPQQHDGMVTLTTIWAAGPTIEAAFLAGPFGGTAAAVLQYVVTTVVADKGEGRTLYSGVLLLVTGIVVGFVSRLVVRAENELRVAAAARAAVAERERLAHPRRRAASARARPPRRPRHGGPVGHAGRRCRRTGGGAARADHLESGRRRGRPPQPRRRVAQPAFPVGDRVDRGRAGRARGARSRRRRRHRYGPARRRRAGGTPGGGPVGTRPAGRAGRPLLYHVRSGRGDRDRDGGPDPVTYQDRRFSVIKSTFRSTIDANLLLITAVGRAARGRADE